MKLHHLKPAEGSIKGRRRVGRGTSGKGGKTAGRGTKGTGARDRMPIGFEGGQMPLKRRQPKLAGFGTPPNRLEYAIVNVAKLEDAFSAGDEVTRDALRHKGLIGKKKQPVKVLGHGRLTKALTVRVDAVSNSAREKISAAGGTVEHAVDGGRAPRD